MCVWVVVRGGERAGGIQWRMACQFHNCFHMQKILVALERIISLAPAAVRFVRSIPFRSVPFRSIPFVTLHMLCISSATSHEPVRLCVAQAIDILINLQGRISLPLSISTGCQAARAYPQPLAPPPSFAHKIK